MKPRYTLLWSTSWKTWICIDITEKPPTITVRDYFFSDLDISKWCYLGDISHFTTNVAKS
jgi:hypothetical protein